MSTAATAHPPPSLTAPPVVSDGGRIVRRRPGPAWLLAGSGLVPLGVASLIAFLPPAAALVTAFFVVVIAVCALALLALDMASDDGEA